MITFFNLFILATFASSEPIHLGTYSSAPIVNDTIVFELLDKNKAVVTSDYFKDARVRNLTPKKVIKGTWKYQAPFLILTYGKYKDKLRKEDCPQKFPCFKFETSEGQKPSPLDVPYGFGIF